MLPDTEKDKKGGEAKRLVVFETDAGPEAYAVYKTKAEWNARGPAGVSPWRRPSDRPAHGTREIWRYLLNVDLVRTLKMWRLPSDHALFALAAEPRRLGTTMGDGLWVRILDVAAALEGRTYGLNGNADGELIFDLRDEYCPWNAGRWKIVAEAGKARVTRTEFDAGPCDGHQRPGVALPGRFRGYEPGRGRQGRRTAPRRTG